MTTNAWVLHPDNHGLPTEELPVLNIGESGESYGWPPGLLGPQSALCNSAWAIAYDTS